MNADDGPNYRLLPDFYEPEWVPECVSKYSSEIDTLAVGSPGKIGILDLTFERVDTRTELVRRFQKSPLQLMRPLYVDPQLPGLPVAYLTSTGGGIVQGDRLRQDVHVGDGASVHLTTTAASKVMTMEHDYAALVTHVRCGANSYVEYLPDPVIPYPRARFYQQTVVECPPSSAVILGEVVLAGRLARDERHLYDVYASDMVVRRDSHTPVALDTIRLCPQQGVDGPSVFGTSDVMGTLTVVTETIDLDELCALFRATALGGNHSSAVFGTSVLPGDCGVWLRIFGDDPRHVSHALTRAWDIARKNILGVPSFDARKA